MVQENPDRNFLVYELWGDGHTIDEISFETGIPRSTVGYYVSKFNKCAKSGEPIVCQRVREKPDAKAIAVRAYVKTIVCADLIEKFKNREFDKAYKMLMCLKLFKELDRDINPTEEERQAFSENRGYVFEQILLASKSASA